MIGRYRSKFKQFDDNGNLLCYSCKEYKPLDCFDRNPDKWFRAEKDTRCKECKKKAYLMKSDLTIEQLKYFCKSILEYKK